MAGRRRRCGGACSYSVPIGRRVNRGLVPASRPATSHAEATGTGGDGATRPKLSAIVLLGALGASLPGAACTDAGWEALKRPGAVAIMRHAIAPGTGDPAAFRLGDCSTQRNLDARGRAQARAIGDAIRAAGVEIDRVLTSQWCRSRETAELLGLGPVEDMPALNSFFADRSTRKEQTRAVRDHLAALPKGERVMLVTHQVNITALTGRGVSSGEVFVLDVAPDGRVEVVDAILIRP